MITLSEPQAQRSTPQDSRLRVVLLLDVQDGEQERFLDAYEQLRHNVASVPGHVSDQLCQSIENPTQWLITSEWESAHPFLEWVDSASHRDMVRPLHGCVRDTRSLRFSIMRETSVTGTADSGAAPLATRPGSTDGIIRHALTFTVKPGTESKVARILAGYTSPAAQVDETTRLARTSLYMQGNRVVRAVEVVGDLVAALRHVAQQPEVRAVEEAINPYLEEARDLGDPLAARDFFMRAALPAVHHAAVQGEVPAKLYRHALGYPVRSGCGAALAELLHRQDEAAVADPAGLLVRSTVFQREDIVVRQIDLAVPLAAAPAVALGVQGSRASAVLARLADLGPDHGLPGDAAAQRLLAKWELELVTDRKAP
ncbi:SchA/CurD-like domain-containing protein [Kitasatospora sp. GP82]|uniref:SchA/CurD-like domain-containing protein n=1 Tax=Kitasatospora sp. GP82 TaxID=3035089 RepID=UPI002476E9B5|nr:SchA/CurD-like domain-containing protein [Kitasatospora sp. GP82]MDH6124954.1 heme-degrading monooxygenase HmoA [Kitasatospora sp. GP82]